MTTFGTYARRVRDDDTPVAVRWRALRGCVEAFPAYGYRATWAKLAEGRRLATHRHGVTRVPDLLDALGELEDARRVWLAGLLRYGERRRREKAAGLRRPRRGDVVPLPVAYCPDPRVHPDGPLADVVARVLAAYADGRLGCPNCGAAVAAGWTCAACGIRTSWYD